MIIKCIFLTLGDTSPALRKLHTSHPFSKVNLFWFPSYTCRKLCQAGYTNHLLGLVHINHINVFALLALGGFQVEMVEVGSKTSLVSVPILVLMWVPLGFSCPCQWAWTSTSGALSGSSSSIYFWKMLCLIIQLLKCEGKAKRGLEPEKKKKVMLIHCTQKSLGDPCRMKSKIFTEISGKYLGNIQEISRKCCAVKQQIQLIPGEEEMAQKAGGSILQKSALARLCRREMFKGWTPCSAQVQKLKAQRICKRAKVPVTNISSILLLQPFEKQYLASLDYSELSQHGICFWSSRIQQAGLRQAVLWDGAKHPKNPLGLGMQVRTCRKNSFNQSEALEVQFWGRVEGTDLLLELCWGWEKQTRLARHPFAHTRHVQGCCYQASLGFSVWVFWLVVLVFFSAVLSPSALQRVSPMQGCYSAWISPNTSSRIQTRAALGPDQHWAAHSSFPCKTLLKKKSLYWAQRLRHSTNCVPQRVLISWETNKNQATQGWFLQERVSATSISITVLCFLGPYNEKVLELCKTTEHPHMQSDHSF